MKTLKHLMLHSRESLYIVQQDCTFPTSRMSLAPKGVMRSTTVLRTKAL